MVKFLKDNLGAVVLCLVEIVVGILLLVNPVGFTSGILMLVGVLLTLLGVVNIITYFRTDALTAAKESGLTKGLLLAGVGVFFVFRAESFIQTFSFLTVLYGLAVLIIGVTKIQSTVDKFRLKMDRWYVAAIGAVLTLLFGIIILFNPFGTTVVLWQFVAITLLVEAAVDVLTLILVRMKQTEEDLIESPADEPADEPAEE